MNKGKRISLEDVLAACRTLPVTFSSPEIAAQLPGDAKQVLPIVSQYLRRLERRGQVRLVTRQGVKLLWTLKGDAPQPPQRPKLERKKHGVSIERTPSLESLEQARGIASRFCRTQCAPNSIGHHYLCLVFLWDEEGEA